MLLYMLDTDISSYIMNQSNQAAIRKLRMAAVGEVCISAITLSELQFGIEVSPKREKDENSLRILLQHVEVLEYPREAASQYAKIRSFLKARGLIIGANDLLIAAHASSRGLTLATNNVREYGRVPGLVVENWTEPIV
jgi:tRNA(fMet)-specific endonuclease VapC